MPVARRIMASKTDLKAIRFIARTGVLVDFSKERKIVANCKTMRV
jgi:hypothetical protein